MTISREQAQLPALVAALVQLIGGSLDLTQVQQTAVSALAVTIAGFITAVLVSYEKAAALVAGLGQAAIAVALSFGAVLSLDTQAAIMTVLTIVIGYWLRTQVTSSTPDKALVEATQ